MEASWIRIMHAVIRELKRGIVQCYAPFRKNNNFRFLETSAHINETGGFQKWLRYSRPDRLHDDNMASVGPQDWSAEYRYQEADSNWNSKSPMPAPNKVKKDQSIWKKQSVLVTTKETIMEKGCRTKIPSTIDTFVGWGTFNCHAWNSQLVGATYPTWQDWKQERGLYGPNLRKCSKIPLSHSIEKLIFSERTKTCSQKQCVVYMKLLDKVSFQKKHGLQLIK